MAIGMDESIIKRRLCDSALGFESRPLVSLEQLFSWSPSTTEQELINICPNLEPSVLEDGPRVLVCHDMKGGYLEDRFASGCDSKDVYKFSRWSQVDIFVYFSHHFVTVPPITWISAAHRNGVPILGTLITEGAPGKKLCQQILASEESVEKTVKQLVEIARRQKFEGWLLNVENRIEETQMPLLLEFVRKLTALSHEQIPNSQIIWYDSVIHPTGKLDWQNALNSKNFPFFELCDGIYLNYCWKDENLEETEKIANTVNRNYDVYVGVDVFGRGCFGGGGMNTNAAIEFILKYKLSIALFAPGWVHEVLGPKNFEENENTFWSKLSLKPRRRLCKLPIETTFCPGYGSKFFQSGYVACGAEWCNLLLQALQPTYNDGSSIYTEDGINGGGCLLLNKSNTMLFACDIDIPSPGCVITIKTKDLDNSFLKTEDSENRVNISIVGTEREVVLFPIPVHKEGKTPPEGLTSEYGESTAPGWTIHHYEIMPGFEKVKRIDVLIHPPGRKLLLGEFKIDRQTMVGKTPDFE